MVQNSVVAISGAVASKLPTPILLDPLLAGLERYDPILRSQLIVGFRFGVDIGYRGIPNSNTKVLSAINIVRSHLLHTGKDSPISLIFYYKILAR